MEPSQLRELIQVLSDELEEAMEQDKPSSELLKIYREIKKLRFELTEKENPLFNIA